MKFKFDCSTVIEARSQEDALSAIADHVSTVNRQVASDRSLADCGAKFTITQVDDKAEAVPLKDEATVALGPIELELDPKSPQGIALEEQKVAEAEAARLAEEANKKNTRTDAENLADHSAKEQAALAVK